MGDKAASFLKKKSMRYFSEFFLFFIFLKFFIFNLYWLQVHVDFDFFFFFFYEIDITLLFIIHNLIFPCIIMKLL